MEVAVRNAAERASAEVAAVEKRQLELTEAAGCAMSETKEAAGMMTKRIPKIASCWVCATGKRKCRLPVTREFWEEEMRELKGKVQLCDDSTILLVVPLVTLSMKWK